LKGLNFFGLLEKIKEAFGKEIDLIEMSEIEKGSEIEEYINNNGIIVYEK